MIEKVHAHFKDLSKIRVQQITLCHIQESTPVILQEVMNLNTVYA
jgi:hypothetical protein